MPGESHKTHVTLTLKHPLTDEELKKLQLTTDALEVFQGGHHHDHDSGPIIVGPRPPIGDPVETEI
jgi:hypothetical protein